MTRRAHRVDGNQPEIFKHYRTCGFPYIDMSGIGHGIPDSFVCFFGTWVPVEIKMPGEDLTDDERRYHEYCQEVGAPIYIVYWTADVDRIAATYQRLEPRAEGKVEFTILKGW